MRKGFAFLELLIFWTMLMSIVGMFVWIVVSTTSVARSTMLSLYEKYWINHTLDQIALDYAVGENNTYVAYKNRVAKKTTGYEYLTPKEFFVVSVTAASNPQTLYIQTNTASYERVLRRR